MITLLTDTVSINSPYEDVHRFITPAQTFNIKNRNYFDSESDFFKLHSWGTFDLDIWIQWSYNGTKGVNVKPITYFHENDPRPFYLISVESIVNMLNPTVFYEIPKSHIEIIRKYNIPILFSFLPETISLSTKQSGVYAPGLIESTLFHIGLRRDHPIVIFQISNALNNQRSDFFTWPVVSVLSTYLLHEQQRIFLGQIPYDHNGNIQLASLDDHIKNLDSKNKLFLCYNNHIRLNRTILYCALKRFNLIDISHYSWNYPTTSTPDLEFNNRPSSLLKNLIAQLYEEVYPGGEQINIPRIVLDNRPFNEMNRGSVPEHYLDSWFSIVTETSHGSLEEPFEVCISEKIAKTIANCHPFMIAADYGHLDVIKQLGFKSFEKFFDYESYQYETNLFGRMWLIANEARRFSSFSPEEKKKRFLDIADVLEHNYNHFFKTDWALEQSKRLAIIHDRLMEVGIHL